MAHVVKEFGCIQRVWDRSNLTMPLSVKATVQVYNTGKVTVQTGGEGVRYARAAFTLDVDTLIMLLSVARDTEKKEAV